MLPEGRFQFFFERLLSIVFGSVFDDVLTMTAQTCLGLTIDCAGCHHHKIDPIQQRDDYRLLSFFQNVRRYGVRTEGTVADASIISIDQPEHSGVYAAAVRQCQQELTAVEEGLAGLDAPLRRDLRGVEIDEFQYAVNRVKLLEKRAGDSLEQQVQLVLSRVLHRPPLPEELSRGVRLIHDLKNNHDLPRDQAQQYICLLALDLNESI